jgi:hypothetical protein
VSLSQLAQLGAQAPAASTARAPGVDDKPVSARTTGTGPNDSERRLSPAISTPRDSFDALTRYIPTETVTLFVAACAAFRLDAATGFTGLKLWLWVAGVVLSPLVLVLVAFGRHRQSGTTARFTVHPWPPVAAAIAFAIWSLSVPGILPGALGLPAAFGALFVSTFLSLLEPVFGPRPVPANGGTT